MKQTWCKASDPRLKDVLLYCLLTNITASPKLGQSYLCKGHMVHLRYNLWIIS